MAKFGEARFPRIGDSDYEWVPVREIRAAAPPQTPDVEEALPLPRTDDDLVLHYYRAAQESLGISGADISPAAILTSIKEIITRHQKRTNGQPTPAAIIAWEAFGLMERHPDFERLKSHLDSLVSQGPGIQAESQGYSVIENSSTELPVTAVESAPSPLSDTELAAAIAKLRNERRRQIKLLQ